MTNSLALGCDCKGSIHYLDASFVRKCVCNSAHLVQLPEANCTGLEPASRTPSRTQSAFMRKTMGSYSNTLISVSVWGRIAESLYGC